MMREERIGGTCPCGQAIIKIINSTIRTPRADGVRYAHVGSEDEPAAQFRCRACLRVIDENWQANTIEEALRFKLAECGRQVFKLEADNEVQIARVEMLKASRDDRQNRVALALEVLELSFNLRPGCSNIEYAAVDAAEESRTVREELDKYIAFVSKQDAEIAELRGQIARYGHTLAAKDEMLSSLRAEVVTLTPVWSNAEPQKLKVEDGDTLVFRGPWAWDEVTAVVDRFKAAGMKIIPIRAPANCDVGIIGASTPEAGDA